LVDPGRQVVLSADNDTAIYFTLDGSDPRLTDGSISPNAQRYTMPIPIIQRTTVLARGLRSGEWTAIDSNLYVTDALPATPESLRISELNFNPHDALPQFGELNVDNDEFEFIELTNVSSTPVNLGGVSLVRSGGEGVEFTFGSQILSPGAHVVIPQNRAAVVSRYGSAITLAIGQGPEEEAWTFDGRLGNGGETITLVTSTGQLIERVAYRDSSPWPNRADGNASSLERVDLAGDANRPQSWRASDRFGGSPAMATASITSHVVMNEILARPAGGDVDAIELFNASSSLTDVSGWYLSDSDADYFRYRIPPETSLAPNAYRVLDQRAFGFGIDGSTGDTLFLIAADAAGRPTHFVDVVAFDASDSAVSLGRWPNATGRLFPQQQTSLGSVNTGPQLGDVIVSELHFHPDDPDGGGILTSDVLEFIEVTNRSSASVDLSGWSLAGDVQFTFADNVQLAAGATLVITSFDAVTNPARDVTFRLAMDVAATLRTVGPWTGTLEDQGGLVQLFKPAQIDANPMTTGRILVDEVEYKIEAPWPTGIGGTGHSLSRVRVDAFGDSPTSWQAAKASPGRAEFTAGPLGDVNGDGILNGTDADLLCSALRDLDPLSQFDLNADGRVNQDDLDLLIRDLLNSGPGDANLDGVFNSRDLVQIFIAAEYEDAMAGNSTWSEGDWNCDGEFNSRDIVLAFVEGDYSARAVRQSWALLAAAREDERPRRAARVDRAFALESR
jgi:hypothetical protein